MSADVLHLGDTIARFVSVIHDSGTSEIVPTTGLTAVAIFKLNKGSEIEKTMQPLSPESSGAFAYRFQSADYTGVSAWLTKRGTLRARVKITDTSGDTGKTSTEDGNPWFLIPVEE